MLHVNDLSPESEGNSSGDAGEKEANQWPTAEPPVYHISS